MSTNKTTLVRIGEYIAKLRKENGYTQKTLSEKLFVGEKTVSKWERGIVAPDIDIIKSMSKLFNVSVEEIINGESFENNYDNKESATITAVKIYSEQTKKKSIRIVVLIFSLLVFTFTTIFLVDHHYRWSINKFSVDDIFHISGYFFQNNSEAKIVINKIIFDDTNAGTENEIKTNKINVDFYSNDELICSNENNYPDDVTLYKSFSNYSFACESEHKLDTDNISLVISYYVNEERIQKKCFLN